MASNKFFTIMVVPEKSQKVTKIVVPSYVFKGGILSMVFVVILALIMFLDYANVMNQIRENKQLKLENRQLRQSVQIFKTKIVGMENTLDRVKTFVTKLRIITNIEDTSPLPNFAPTNPQQLPLASPTVPNPLGAPILSAPSTPLMNGLAAPLPTPEPTPRGKKGRHRPREAEENLMIDTSQINWRFPQLFNEAFAADESETTDAETEITDETFTSPKLTRSQMRAQVYDQMRASRLAVLSDLMKETTESFQLGEEETSQYVQAEFEKLDHASNEVNQFAVAIEQETQDILEKLSEKRTLLASTPTRIPTFGYVTSDYGVRVSPFDGRRKMHEGIDIANRYGADVIAPADGIVTFSGVKPGYGKIVILDHGNGIETRFGHNSRLVVEHGVHVKRGQVIALVGNTGHSTGPHCHYEVHANGLPVDPCWYILDQPQMCRGR